MFKHLLLTTWRNFSKNKLNSFINVLGLSVGVAVSLCIVFFIGNEQSWDSIHTKGERIYRVNEIQDFPGSSKQKVALTMYPMGPTIGNDFSQVESFTRYFPSSAKLISNGEKKLVTKNSFWVDASFFDVFSFPVLSGDPQTALLEPNSAVVTESMAKQIFGSSDATGKIFLRDTTSFKVSAVLKDLPENSHLQFDALFSISTVDGPEYQASWGSNMLGTYVLLKPNTDKTQIEKGFSDYITKHIPQYVKNYQLYLQPLNSIHLGSADMNHDMWNYKSFNGAYISVFMLLAGLILVIAFMNFINLAVASSAARAKEVGIKKTIGASRQRIVWQFMAETITLTLFSFSLGLALAYAGIPLLNQLTDRHIEFAGFIKISNFFIFYGAAVLLAVIAGIYPSFYMASFKAIKVLKGKIFEPGQRFPARNILVTAQFSIAIILIIVTVLVNQQLNFMRSKDPGFNTEQVVILPASNQAIAKKDILQSKIENVAGVQAVSYSGQRLGGNFNQGYIKFQTPNDGIKEANAAFSRIDEKYIPLYGLKIIRGRNFSKEMASDGVKGYLINESLAKDLGWADPIGKDFAMGGSATPLGKIIGVVKDFNFNSFKTKIEPLCFTYGSGYKEISIKLRPGNVQKSLADIRQTWDDIVKDQPFEYSFLDEHFALLYKTEMQLSRVTTIAAGLAIFLACLGILGLISITIQQKLKEIGIRKILGASITNIVLILSKNIIKLVMLAALIAFPVSWWAVNSYLGDFAYRIPIHWWVFLLAGGGTLAIALLTISIKSVKAALVNPVKNLRVE